MAVKERAMSSLEHVTVVRHGTYENQSIYLFESLPVISIKLEIGKLWVSPNK
jgi:hypothetical protein